MIQRGDADQVQTRVAAQTSAEVGMQLTERARGHVPKSTG